MKFNFRNLFKRRSVKANPVGTAMFFGHNTTFMKRELAAFAEEGYRQNIIVYRSINEIASGVRSVGLEIKVGDSEEFISDNPILTLLQKPNPMQTGKSFRGALTIHYEYAGEFFIVRSGQRENGGFENNPPSELWILRPDKMTVVPGEQGIPKAYEYVDKKKIVFPVDQGTGYSDVLHVKMTNPLNIWRGMSPLEAAAYGIDIHNEGSKWNKGLLQNGARPSGALVFKEEVGEAALQNLRKEMNELHTGGRNAGRPRVLTGGANWLEFSKSPKDMDFKENMTQSAMNIASAFGVPFPLVIPTAANLANYKIAREILWESTILPLLAKMAEEVGEWLAPQFGVEDIVLKYNADDVPALQEKRNQKIAGMVTAVNSGLLTRNEAREQLNYKPKDGADALTIPANLMPADEETSDPEMSEEEKGELNLALVDSGYNEAEADVILEDDFNIVAS